MLYVMLWKKMYVNSTGVLDVRLFLYPPVLENPQAPRLDSYFPHPCFLNCNYAFVLFQTMRKKEERKDLS